MSTLIISLPLLAASPSSLYAHTEGQAAPTLRNASAALLPPIGRSTDVVAVVPAQALSWHAVDLPAGKPLRGPQLRAALIGLLEDRLLDESELLHFALQPQWHTGRRAWVAVCHKAWLRGHLQALEAAGHPVNRVVPAVQPREAGAPWQVLASGTPDEGWLWVCAATGVWGIPFAPTQHHAAGHSAWATRLGLPEATDTVAGQEPQDWTLQAEPALAAMAEQALQRKPELVQPAQGLVQAAQTDWDLAQFDLAATGSARWIKTLLRTRQTLWTAPHWRPARWGVGVLLLTQLCGLNVWAWKLQSDLRSRQADMKQVITQTFPEIQIVVDAPLQMAREVQRLRQAAGLPQADGLEPMLAALGAALPAGQSIRQLDFQAGELRIQGPRLSATEADVMAQRLQTAALRARRDGEQWVITAGSVP
jgi:general secretion pathway protein L